MTTLLEDVQAALDACVPTGGAWPGANTREPPTLAGDGTVAPYIVWTRVVSVDNVNLSGASNVQNTRLQVDIFAPRLSDAESVRIAADAAMAASPVKAIPISLQNLYEDVPKLHRILREYSAWR